MVTFPCVKVVQSLADWCLVNITTVLNPMLHQAPLARRAPNPKMCPVRRTTLRVVRPKQKSRISALQLNTWVHDEVVAFKGDRPTMELRYSHG